MVVEYREYFRKPLLTLSDRPSALSSQVDPEFRDILQPLQEDYGAVKKKEMCKIRKTVCAIFKKLFKVIMLGHTEENFPGHDRYPPNPTQPPTYVTTVWCYISDSVWMSMKQLKTVINLYLRRQMNFTWKLFLHEIYLRNDMVGPQQWVMKRQISQIKGVLGNSASLHYLSFWFL